VESKFEVHSTRRKRVCASLRAPARDVICNASLLKAAHTQMRANFADVLEFWFGSCQSRERGRPRAKWFEKNPALDGEIRARFLPEYEAAARGELGSWEATPYASLALVIVLDQFGRNSFRDDPRAFAADSVALAVARRLTDRGFDRLLLPVERCFAYLPFEHAEDLAAQRRSLALFGSLSFSDDCSGYIDYARRHFDIIARFGRFPHRNAILGRASTQEELRFLDQPGSRF
jgi:uncharacterized protein (DUF924 family)